MTIVLVGCHGAGKTTIGTMLAQRLGLPFHDEIGRSLAEDRRWRASGTAADAQPAFDDEVFRREIARDRHVGGRVVETWHAGNLAYAARRSPAVVSRWLDTLQASSGGAIVVVPLWAPFDVLRARQSEPGDLAFFVEIARDTLIWVERLGLASLAPVDTSAACPNDLAEHVMRGLHAHGRS